MNIDELNDKVDRLDKKYDELSCNVNNSLITITRIDTKLDNMKESFNELKVDIKAMTATPAKRWNTVIYSMIQSIVTVAISVAVSSVIYVGNHFKSS